MPWAPVDFIVLIMATALAAALVLAAISPILLRQPISDARSKFLSAIAIAIITLISLYVGGKIQPGQ